MLNLNNVPSDDNNREFELIPDGTIVRAFIKLEGGSTELPEYGAGSFFEVSQATNAKWLPIELTIIGGNFDKRKIWHRIFVDGTTPAVAVCCGAACVATGCCIGGALAGTDCVAEPAINPFMSGVNTTLILFLSS